MSSVTLKFKIFDAKGTHLLALAKSTATVGSAAHCDVVFSHPSVQGEHARAWCEGGRIWLQDMGTPAGTTLNGIRLPPLKPMLVRELDIVKLGDCPSTMGMEPNMVRAPVVKPQSAVPEFTATDIRPLVSPDAGPEKKQEEFERMHRELADLKLRVQMAQLDKDSGEELRKELSAARAEVARLSGEKQKLKESFSHFDGDKKTFKLQLENEVAEIKLKSLRELKEQREGDLRKFDRWKAEIAGQLTAAARTLAEQKNKAWSQRPFSKEMMNEWDADMASLFRRLILSDRADEAATPPKPEITKEEVLKSSTATNGVSAGKTKSSGKKKKARPSGEDTWQRVALGGLVVAAFMAVAWYASAYLKKDGARSLASQIETAPPSARPAPAAAAAVNPDAGKTGTFKKSYTENVLGTINYVDAELNMDFRALWLKDLSRVATKEWKLDPKLVNQIAAKEIALIQDLNRLKGAPAQMRQRESQFMQELQQQLGKKVTTDKFMRLKRSFYTRNQVYLTRETR